MSPSSHQLHGYVGRSYELAAEIHCLHSVRKGGGDKFWAMTFPRVYGLEMTSDNQLLETNRRISMRVSRRGYQGWSLTVLDVSEMVRPDSVNEFSYVGNSVDQEAVFSGIPSTFTVLRAIHKVVWGERTGVEISSKRLEVIGNAGDTENPVTPSEFLACLNGVGELWSAELDMSTVTKSDIDFMREELEQHAATIRTRS